MAEGLALRELLSMIKFKLNVTLATLMVLSTVSGIIKLMITLLPICMVMMVKLIIIIVVGNPILKLDVCSEFEVSFTCTVIGSTTLNWDIDFSSPTSDDDLDRIAFYDSDTIGYQFTLTAQGTDAVYTFNLTSKSPLTSTMTTNKSTDLSGATVSCSKRLQVASSADTDKLTLPSKYIQPSIIMS